MESVDGSVAPTPTPLPVGRGAVAMSFTERIQLARPASRSATAVGAKGRDNSPS